MKHQVEDTPTIQHYDRNADTIADRYENADMSALHRIFQRFLEPGHDILEIGCGSGRDAAILKSLGCNVTATDASGGTRPVDQIEVTENIRGTHHDEP